MSNGARFHFAPTSSVIAPQSSVSLTLWRAGQCPLWVKQTFASQCPLYTRERTCAVQLAMSAKGQKQTFAEMRQKLEKAIGECKD
jgi:hypothetical protein